MANSGDEEAEEQLFAELRASAKKIAQTHSDPATRHAFLLNAARANHQHTLGPSVPSSSPSRASHTSLRSNLANMARRGGAGKLHPVLLREDLAKRQRPNLARRGDPFALDISSPEKAPIKPPKQRVQASSPKTKHKKKRTHHSAVPGIAREIAQDIVQETGRDSTHHVASNSAQEPRIDIEDLAARAADTAIQETMVDRQSPVPSPSHDGVDPQEEELDKRQANPRKRKAPGQRREGKKLGNSSNKEINGHDHGTEATKAMCPTGPQVVTPTSRRSTRQSKAQPPRDVSPDVVAPVRKTRTQMKETEQELPPSSRSKAQVTRGRVRPPKKSRHVPDEHEETEQGRDNGENAAHLHNQGTDQDDAYDPPQANEVSPTDDDETEDENENSFPGVHDRSDLKNPDIVAIFKYASAERRIGTCQTDDATNIRRACQSARRLIVDHDVTLEQIGEANDEILDLLSAYVTSQDHGHRKDLKTDAYAYLFKEVSRYLTVLHAWVEEQFDDFESSLTAMRIIAPVVRAILATKDQISFWKVKLPVRYKNDRLVKDVERDLMNPLRRVNQVYDATLRILEDTAEKQSVHEKALQEGRKKFAAREKKRQDAANNIVRRQHWVDLHVFRLQVESDPSRRQALSFREDYFTSMTQSREERDSNGIAFERLDVFKKRDSTPAKYSSVGELEEWTDGQLAALVEGLMEFAGPDVFPMIFKKYCGRGGPLRRFGVPEVTAAAAYMRTRLLKQFQEQDWEVPEWIEKIPLFP